MSILKEKDVWFSLFENAQLISPDENKGCRGESWVKNRETGDAWHRFLKRIYFVADDKRYHLDMVLEAHRTHTTLQFKIKNILNVVLLFDTTHMWEDKYERLTLVSHTNFMKSWDEDKIVHYLMIAKLYATK